MTTTRITGLSSGLDVDSLVKQLMKAEKTKYDNMVKKRTKTEWQQEDYRSMAAKIVDFRNNKLASFNLSSAISAKTSEVSGDTSALTINSTSSSASGTLNVTVNQVATSSSYLYSFKSGTTSFATDTDITINGQKITMTAGQTMSDLADAINKSTGTYKASAIYSNGQLSITATNTGADGLSVSGFDSDTVTADETTYKGVNAKVTVNGVQLAEQASNKFSVNGFTFTAKNKTATDSSTTITATRDTAKIVETIKSFVSEYNSLISSINSELSEKKYYDYNPLTSDEKEEMSDDEIELWESKARSGTLHSDSTLSKMLSEFRTAATSLVAGGIGITTGSYSENGKLILDETKLTEALESDPDKVVNLFSAKSSDTSPSSKTSGVFAKMMDSAMDALKSMQTKAGTSTTSTDTTATFLENSLLSSQIRDMKSREEREQDRLDDLEDYYYKMFSAMETAISKYNSQASAFSSLTSSS
ncbi:flagellar hook-associated protein 2 [Paenibacillus cellulosilyticus]|uniref:Flagellar hook-associated protein 2 n=1 Tax=Paenibacillus cellulosilyticus TaxID=375489 RepID=A0A2V2Z0P5_9BACL|nr:flagellar filament capping protein FliD [Paenibacillus cellulosilyticus]PWW08352.1 flagellar hook-associated protein 2 [Paenibacillus cellulosilyticus]QKS47950.1 flagellar filament capping protein FliD [Paenibacillus cellulosilyticus]